MEGAPLRPVPARPEGPVDPAEAVRHVRETLPGLDKPAATALALSALAGRARAELTSETGLEPEGLAEALARGRKALRRSLFPLPGSGWCERAERLISDRLDGELAPPGPARLDAHLRNCGRCVEHDRRLAQATDSLVTTFVERHPASEPEPEPQPEPEPEPAPTPSAELRIVEPAAKPAPAEPAPASAEPEPEQRPHAAAASPSIAVLAWHGLFALAVLLAVATVAIAVIGILGGNL